MPSPFTLARAWRILKEVDLDAIRREADLPIRVLLVADTPEDADALAVLLAEGEADPTPFLVSMDARLAASHAGQGVAADAPDIVVAITHGVEASDELVAARQGWAARRSRVVTVAVGGTRPGHVRTGGGLAGVSIDRIDAGAVPSIAEAILSVAGPERRVALARRLPGLRPRVFDELITETARANAGYAFSTGLAEIVPLLDIPLNIGDVIVLTKNQLLMAYRLALAAGKQGRPRELVGEIVGVLGGGLLFRQVARQLIGLLPVVGLVPKVAVAYGGTWVIGRAVVAWATEGRRLSRARLGELSREGLARGRRIAQSLRRGHPAA
jgi:uncharacterized protein (DUF697 family)